VESLTKLGIITRGVSDRYEWQPLFVIVTRFPGQHSAMRANAGGYLFLPLVWLDRGLCHPTRPMYQPAANGVPPAGGGIASLFRIGQHGQAASVVEPERKRPSALANHMTRVPPAYRYVATKVMLSEVNYCAARLALPVALPLTEQDGKRIMV